MYRILQLPSVGSAFLQLSWNLKLRICTAHFTFTNQAISCVKWKTWVIMCSFELCCTIIVDDDDDVILNDHSTQWVSNLADNQKI